MADEGKGSGRGTAANPEIDINTDYFIRTLYGRLVLIELLLTLICGICASSTGSYYPGYYGFLSFVAWTSFLNLLIFAILKLIGLWDRFRMFWIFPHPIIPVIFYGLAVAGFVIGFILAAVGAGKPTTTGAGTAAAVFAVVCLVIFVLELFFATRAFRSSEREAQEQAPQYDPEPVGVV